MIIHEMEVPERAKAAGGKYLFTLSADGGGISCSYWARGHDNRAELARLLMVAAASIQDIIYERQSRARADLHYNVMEVDLKGNNHG